MELVKHLNLAKLFQSLDSKIVFMFLFLTFGLRFCVVIEFEVL